ncbi:MAG: hypothetical protein QOG59_1759 [Solirubrobacteraceae bacterium]|jgi:hypothetical protein|nr:hypothetical protein [Solirubrobacteraceae bacterium]
MGRRGPIKLGVLVSAAVLCAFPGVAGAATGEVAYGGQVRVTGKLLVTFSGGDVTSGTITWSPPSTGSLQLLSGGAGARKWLRGSLSLSGNRPTTTASIHHAGSGVCTGSGGYGGDVELPVIAASPTRVRFAWFARHAAYSAAK